MTCPCGKGNQHSLRDGGRCDGLRKYGKDYKTPKQKKEKKQQ